MVHMKRLVIIDGKSVFYRGYYAMPGLSTKDGIPTGGVFGFASLSLEIVKKLEPDYVCVAWDKKHTSIRKRLNILPTYKAGRKTPPSDFFNQIPILHELLDAFGWPLYEFDDYEADDIVYALLQKSKKEGNQTFIACNDADLLPLVDNNTVLLYWKQNAYSYPDLEKIDKYSVKIHYKEYLIFDTEYFTDACKTIYSLNKYNVTEDNLLLVKMLRGDPSDDIQGVKGWTPTKVKNILTSNSDLKIKYNMDLKDLENILEKELSISKKDTKQALKNYKMMDLNSSLNNRRKPLKY